jgi:hypothetical protein
MRTKHAITSDIKNTINQLFLKKIAVLVSLLPPGTVKAAVKTIVAINVATSMQ